MGMLEYSKRILKKVYFDKALFMKELIKAFDYLDKDEKVEFKKWCLEEFTTK